MMRRTAATVVLLLAMGNTLAAEPLHAMGASYRMHTERPFAQTVESVQYAIEAAGYRVLRMQRIDVGLRAAGYKTQPYRIVFYSTPEIREVIERRPELSVFLPLAIAVYADGTTTRLTAQTPLAFASDTDARLTAVAKEWDQGVRTILARVHAGETP